MRPLESLIRDQFDAQWDGEANAELSFETGLDCSADVELGRGARQEFRDEADINVLLRRFGAIPPGAAQPFGEFDFDLTLQDAIAVGQESQRAWFALPAEVRAKYRSWPEVLAAVERGEVKFKAPPAAEEAVETPPA